MPPKQNQTKPPSSGELQQIVERLRSANNVLVTISNDPSVDQFAACIGLTLALNKLNKHANAVFSGAVPSTIDFLKPEQTLEKNTDSLRDFIIALDKSKADKLRYKVENDVVRIFITPYRTNISEKDLKFTHGDFNVDAVVALGVHDKSHLDAAILAHGRILHDAAFIAVNNNGSSKLGSINWTDTHVSSLCEMVVDVASELSKDVFDKQIATALLTGIVAETERYSNEKASPHTMSVAGILMSAGASTQLVSSKLEAPEEKTLPKIQEKPEEDNAANEDDGVIEIDHSAPKQEDKPEEDKPVRPAEPAEPVEQEHYDSASQIEIDDSGRLKKTENSTPKEENNPTPSSHNQAKPASRMINQPPSRGGRLTANDQPEDYASNPDPLRDPASSSAVSYDPPTPTPKIGPAKASGLQANQTDEETDKTKNQTLSDIEKSVSSRHSEPPSKDKDKDEVPELAIDESRKAVEQATGEAESESTLPQVRDDLSAESFEADAPGSKADNPAPQASSPPPKVPPPPMIPPQ